ncbi:MAG: helix-turn-helix domain-containing protein [Paludibacterium sp.]|nr:helix-turn-helix domain-containing protein [Paludibacterium sp.]
MSDNPGSSPARHFTVHTLAAYWGVSPSHIYNLVHSNALRHLRIGKAIRIPEIFIKEFEEAACQEAMKNTDFGRNQTASFISSGTSELKLHPANSTHKQDAFQQGQRIGTLPSSSAPNSSQD